MAKVGFTRNSRGQYQLRDSDSGRFAGAMKLGEHLAAADLALEKIQEGTKTLGEGMEGLADKAGHLALRLGEVGIAAGIAFATHGVIGLNAELEQTQISLGAIFQAQGYYKSFEAGFSRAGEEVAKMKKDVMALPVTFGQLRETMAMIATPASEAGAKIDQIRVLAEKTTLVAGILQVPQEMAAQQMAQLLQGHMNSRNRFGIELGFEAKSFNAEGHSKQLADIEKAFARYNDSADRFSQSFKTNATSLKDNALNFEAAATKGLFEHVKATLAEANTWFDTHKQKVAELASLIDNRLSSAWTTIERVVKSISREIGPWIDKIAHMQPAEIGAKLEHVAEMGLGLKVGGMAISAGSGIIGVGGAGASAGGVAALGAAALYATPFILGAGGALHILRDNTLQAHEPAVKLAHDIGTNLTQAMRTLDQDTEKVRGKMGQFVDQMGLVSLGAADLAAKGFNKLLQGMHALGEEGVRVGQLFLDTFKSKKDIDAKRTFDASVDGPVNIKDHFADTILLSAFRHGTEREHEQNLKKTPSNNTLMKVEIVVKGSDDPSRVARLTLEHLTKIARNPNRSAFVPDYSSPRLR